MSERRFQPKDKQTADALVAYEAWLKKSGSASYLLSAESMFVTGYRWGYDVGQADQRSGNEH